MGVVSIRQGIVAALEGIGGLRVYDHRPESVSEFPAALVWLRSANYTDGTFTFVVSLLAGGWSAGEAERSLHPFLESRGSKSVRAAVDGQSACLTVSAGEVGWREVNGSRLPGVDVTVVATDG